jgi:hypothetical protein
MAISDFLGMKSAAARREQLGAEKGIGLLKKA